MLVTVLALCAALHQSQSSTSVAAAIDARLDPEIWGDGHIGGVPPNLTPPLAPIVPGGWLVVPRSAAVSVESALARWILDPTAAPPTNSGEFDLAEQRWVCDDSAPCSDAVCAYTCVEAEAAHVRMARLSGGAWMLVNGEVFVGDPEHRGFGGVPVALRAGVNHVFVACAEAGFELWLIAPATRMVIEAFDVRWSSDEELHLPLFNASTDATAGIHVHYGHATPWNASCKPSLSDWRDGDFVAPLGLYFGGIYFLGFCNGCEAEVWNDARDELLDVTAPVCVFADEREPSARMFVRRAPSSLARVDNNVKTWVRAPASLPHPLARSLANDALLVYGTLGSDDEDRASLASARLLQQSAWYRTNAVPMLVSDSEYLRAHGTCPWRYSGKSVVLFGNCDTNAAWERVVDTGAGLEARRGRVVLDGQVHSTHRLCGWRWISRNGAEGLVLFDSGLAGARLASLLTLTWRGESEASAVYEVDPDSKTGWRRIEIEGH